MNGKLHIAGLAVAIAIPLTACGGGGNLAAPANGATAPTANGGPVSTLSSNQADVQACTDLQKSAAAFLANKNQDTLNAFAISLAARSGAAMSPSLDAAFSALSGDVQDEMLTGTAEATAQSDENSVAEGCASIGVRMPAGFTG
jgi:hypothetical protein